MPALLDTPYQKQAPKLSPFAPSKTKKSVAAKPYSAPAPAVPPEAQRLQDLNLAELQAQRQQISDDLARQLGQITQQQQWQQEEINKRIGQIETDAPEQQGRLGSSFAARGSYSSGARQEAEKDLMEQFAQQIEGMRTGLEKERQVADWEKEKLNIAAQRGLSDLARRQEAQELEWSMQKQRAAESGRGAGGGRGGMIDPDKYRTEAVAYRDARTNFYRAQGRSLAEAKAMAMHNMRTRYPHLDETWLYGGAGGQPIQTKKWGIYDISADRGREITPGKRAALQQKPAYKQAMGVIQNWLNTTGGRGNFSDWWIRTAKAEGKPSPGSFISKNPQLISVALMDVLYGG